MSSELCEQPTVTEARIAPQKLDAIVTKLNDLQRTATLEYALRVGRLIEIREAVGRFEQGASLDEPRGTQRAV